MFKFMAGAFAALSTMVSGAFGGHGQTVVPHSGDNDQHFGTTTGMVHGEVANALHGTVTAVAGTTITLNGSVGTTTAQSTYTVDASKARFIKGSATSTATIANIVVGDTVTVQGSITGTAVVATLVIDGKVTEGFGHGEGGMMGGTSTSTRGGFGGGIARPMHAANGVFGAVVAVSGTTLSVSGNSVTSAAAASSTFSVDASKATILKTGTTGATVASVVVGDRVMIEGAVSGTSVTATSIVDMGKGALPMKRTGDKDDDSREGRGRGPERDR